MKKIDIENSKLNKKRKNILKRVIKFSLILILLVVSYLCSSYVNGVEKTNLRLLTLIFYTFVGFAGFYLIYYIAYLITYLSYRKSQNNKANQVISCDNEVNDFFKDGTHKFKYDKKLNFATNLKSAFNGGVSIVKDIAVLTSKDCSLFYLNYTVYDALNVFEHTLQFTYSKVDGVFKFFKLQNKPIGLIEKSLTKLIENEKQENKKSEDRVSGLQKFKTNLKNKALNVGILLFSGKIEEIINEIYVFLAMESFNTYSKDSKNKYRQLDSEDAIIEVNNA